MLVVASLLLSIGCTTSNLTKGASAEASRSAAAALLTQADAARDAGKAGAAKSAYRKLTLRYPESSESIQAHMALAEGMSETAPLKAFDEYQMLIDRHVGQFNFQKVIEAQFALAQTVQGKHTGLARVISATHTQSRALPLYQTIIANAPGWAGAAEAQFEIGNIHASENSLVDAINAYDRVINRYAGSTWREDALLQKGKVLLDSATRRNLLPDRVSLAIDDFDRFLAEFKGSEFTDEVLGERKRAYGILADHAYETAKYYDTGLKKREAAMTAYEQFLKDYPNTKHTDTVRARLAALGRSAGS